MQTSHEATPIELPKTLIELQEDLEQEMTGNGLKTYHDAIKKAREKGRESTTGYGCRLMEKWVMPLASGIRDFLSGCASGAAGRRHNASKFLGQVDHSVAAYIACKCLLDNFTKRSRYQDTIGEIGLMIEDEAKFTYFKKEKPGLFRVISAGIQSDHYRHRKAVLNNRMDHYGLEWVSWLPKDRAQIGGKLVELFMQMVPDAIEIVSPTVNSRKHKHTFVQPTAAAEKTIADFVAHSEGLYPAFVPMVIPPRPWAAFRGGGYLTPRMSRGIVKVRGKFYDGYKAEWDQKGEQLEHVYGAINALQDTPWQINRAVLGVMAEAWDHSLDLAGLPVRDANPMPVKPADINTNRAALMEWKRRATEVYTLNIKLVSKRILASRLLQIARKFEPQEAIYFPYQLDFRGRAYAVPLFLNPQGCDMAKGLLRFSKGKPLGSQQAADWLAIHGANLYGYDKVSFQERVLWALKNTEHILLSAMKPLEYRWWTHADDPWQFLAFCMEWRGYMKEKFAFVSHLPIALDGSCNGLQHFSAMLRDPVGGAAVNLVRSEKPSDIYQAVADKAKEMLEKDTQSPYAHRWLCFGIDRKLTKRPVMVVPYGGTRFSCREYVRQHVLEKTAEGKVQQPFEHKDMKKATSYLAGIVWDAIGEVVVAARKAMGYLQQVSRVAAKQDLPAYWTAPSGFPVLQKYPKWDCEQISTRVCGRQFRIWLAKDTEFVDRKRQEQGISPNFVHSLDASALVFTVTSALASGVSNFAMIHDSYGTHACDTEVLAQCCRIAFVEHVYSRDVLADFTEEMKQMLPDGTELPPIPESGSLDLNQVLESPFFFA